MAEKKYEQEFDFLAAISPVLHWYPQFTLDDLLRKYPAIVVNRLIDQARWEIDMDIVQRMTVI